MVSSKTRVAIIEDDFPIVQMYRLKFEADGFDVATAADGETGLNLIGEFKPQVILLDLMMPHMNGLEMLERVRKNPISRASKIVVLTNMGDSETASKVFKLGADDYIVKAQLTPKQVSERVKALLAKR